MTFGICIALIVLFYALGKTADLVVVNTRIISERLNINIFSLGLILGFLTSIPELAVGLNALAQNVEGIALGNLMGGIVVIFGLILGGSLILNRRIKTVSGWRGIVPVLTYLYLPLLFGFDGNITLVEGFVLILIYFFLAMDAYKRNRVTDTTVRVTLTNKEFAREILLIIVGLVCVLLISNVIVRLTLFLLAAWNIPAFVVGLIIFSLGTNLPEITITVRSWSRHIKELSMAHLVGSAMANILILGILAFIKTIPVSLTPSYYMLMLFLLVVLSAFAYFHKIGRALTRREGIMLVSLYGAFLFFEIGALAFK